MFLEIDMLGASPGELTPEAILRYLCPADEAPDMQTIVQRYHDIGGEPTPLVIAPREQRILDKLVWPLRNAKASFMVGNYLGTISLSGMVAEMVGMLLWETAGLTIDGRQLGPSDERSVFGNAFEKLGQERRVNVLSALHVVGDETKGHFDTIRTCRRRYLHLWSQDHEDIQRDAVACFHSAVALVVEAIGQDFVNGKLVLNPRLVKYLEREGVWTDTPYVLRDGSPVLSEDVVAQGPCRCGSEHCAGMDRTAHCLFTRDLSDWVVRKGLYRGCYEEMVVCPRCQQTHKRGHIGKTGTCAHPYGNQESQSD